MRNLEIRTHRSYSFQSEDKPVNKPCWTFCDQTQFLYFVINQKVWKRPLDGDIELLADLSAEGLVMEESRCVSLILLSDTNSLLLGFDTGQLLQVESDQGGGVEEVGGVDCGLAALGVSPDLEMIVLVTQEMSVVTMTRDFTPAQETSLLELNKFGEGEMINVGWGSKETQFHGSEGKHSRTVKTETGEADADDDGEVRLSWRGDGELFSVSFLQTSGDQETRHRRIRVLTRSGALYSLSQPLPGLQWTLDWKPSGSVIAAVVKRHGKQTILFLEKNGLEHGGFDISTELTVTGLSWSNDSEVLVVMSRDTLFLYTVSNYHWYLKQCLRPGGELVSVRWSEDSAVLRCWTMCDQETVVHTWRLGWSTCVSESGSVAVVDGDQVLVTPFKHVTVPPPSSAFTVRCPAPVAHVVWRHCPGDQLMILTCDNNLYKMTSDGAAASGDVSVTVTQGAGYHARVKPLCLESTLSVESDLVTSTNIVCLKDDMMLCSSADQMMLFRNSDKIDSVSMESDVFTVTAVSSCSAVAQLSDGTLVKLMVEDDSLSVEDSGVKWPGVCSTVLSCDQGIIGLSPRFRLYLDNRELASTVTSVSLHSSFLLLTTLDHHLLTIALDQLSQESVMSAAAGRRRVERGSRLVTSVPHHSKTVLQMPRGNIETIHPRALSIVLLTEFLDTDKYRQAFMLARTQRINLNLLVDHHINKFLTNCGMFVEQVSSPEYLTIFIADLSAEDTCTTFYSDQYRLRTTQTVDNKVNLVCEAMRKQLELIDFDKYLLPILATYVRDGKKLEQALAVIKKLKDDVKKKMVDDGLKFLATMVDINALFNVSLGTYDLQMVVMVAEKSQKDPKEYLPFLNNFRKMEEHFRKFSIDQHLQKYESGLVHILNCPDKFDVAHEFIVKHRLFKQALKLIASGSDEHKQVCSSYGEYLESKKYHEEASIMYQRAGKLDSAVTAAVTGLCWQRAAQLARSAQWTNDSLVQMCRQLAAQLETAGRYQESATGDDNDTVS